MKESDVRLMQSWLDGITPPCSPPPWLGSTVPLGFGQASQKKPVI